MMPYSSSTSTNTDKMFFSSFNEKYMFLRILSSSLKLATILNKGTSSSNDNILRNRLKMEGGWF